MNIKWFKYRYFYKNTNEQESVELSKSWCTMVSDWINNKSFWAVVALAIFWFKVCSRWTCNAILTVPEWLDIRAFAFLVEPNSSSSTFTLLCGWIDAPWRITFTFAWLRSGIEFSARWTCSALLGDWIEKLSGGGVTLNTVVSDFIIAVLAL